jgi:hypothetical protein
MKIKIRLETMSDVMKFQEIVSKVEEEVKLIDGSGYCVNAKSVLGAVAALEWKELYVVSEKDLITALKDFYI